MSDDATRPDGPARLVYTGHGLEMRLTEFVDELGRKTRYAYDDVRGVVASREPDGSITEYALPPGRVLARTRHPETGEWVHVSLPEPPAAGVVKSAWPTRLPGTTAEGATAAHGVGGSPALPHQPPTGVRVTTLTYDAERLVMLGLSSRVTTYTYDGDGRLMDVQNPDGPTETCPRDHIEPGTGPDAGM